MATDMRVANTILAQLGGNRFKAMTGAHSFTGTDNSLSFQFKARAKNGIKACRIVLDPSDTYTVEFIKIGRKKDESGLFFVPTVETVYTAEGIYNDVLQEVFTRHTGLATRL